MNMEKERKAFQKFCEENFDFEHHEQTYFDEQTQCYENDIGECTESINMAWDAWQESANRQGYKLVPVETLEECLSWAACASSESWSDEQRDEIDKHYKVIEKAMIGEETK